MGKKLAAVGLGAALLYFLLKPKSARASTLTSRSEDAQKELEREVGPIPAVPAPTTTAPTQEKFTDPGTGQMIAGPSEPIEPGGNYLVKPGESWSNISSRSYGDYRWWPYLWDVNRAKFSGKFTSPDTLSVGDVISLPVGTAGGPGYKKRIFERAKAHAEWWQTKIRLQKSGGRPRPMPALVMELTDVRIS